MAFKLLWLAIICICLTEACPDDYPELVANVSLSNAEQFRLRYVALNRSTASRVGVMTFIDSFSVPQAIFRQTGEGDVLVSRAGHARRAASACPRLFQQRHALSTARERQEPQLL